MLNSEKKNLKKKENTDKRFGSWPHIQKSTKSVIISPEDRSVSPIGVGFA